MLPIDVKEKIKKSIPKIAKLPLKLMPFGIQAKIIEKALDIIFANASNSNLAFLEDKQILIVVSDWNFEFGVAYTNNKWVVKSKVEAPDVTFIGESTYLILIAAGEEDPDTLFFQGKLQIIGDTELGLWVKNLFLATDLSLLPKPLLLCLSGMSDLAKKLQAT